MQQELLQRALDVNWRNLALGSESFEAEGAVFVRNRDFPGIYDANFIYGVTASSPDAVESLLARAAKEYAHAAELTFRIDPGTPPAFEARLGLVAYERSSSLVMLLEGPLAGAPRSADIRPIESEAAWDAYFDLKRADWRDHAVRIGEDPENTAVPDGLAATNRLKCPPVRYFLAYVDGTPCGFFNDWEGIDGAGQVEDLFVLPTSRRRGIATALIRHCVADARAHGAEQLVIVADPTDTPKNIYAAMGWRPIALCRQYGKRL